MAAPAFTQRYDYSPKQATDCLFRELEVVLLLPDSSTYQKDMSKGHETTASRPVIYRRLGGLTKIAEDAGLTLHHINRVAYIPERPQPEIVTKVIETVGRQALLETLLEQSDATELLAIIDAANVRLANNQ